MSSSLFVELELAPFLNKSDVVDQGTTEDITRIADYYPVVSLVRLDSDTSKNRTRKSRNVTEKEREAFFDLDEDFSMNPSPGRNLVTVSDFQDSKNPSSNPLMGCKDSSIEKPCSDNNNQTLRSDMKHCMKSEEAEEEAMFFKPPDGCMNPFSLLLSNNNNINDEDRIIIRTPPPLPPEDSIAFEKWFETFHYPKEAQFGNRDEEIVPHYPLTPPNVVCSWNENQLWDDEFCDPIPWKTPSKEQSVQNVVDCSKRLMNECQDTTSRVLVAKENNNSVLKESLYGTTQLLDLLNDSHSLNKSVNSKLHDNSCRICDKNVCDESTTNFTLSRRESDSCLSAKFQRNSPTWDQYSNLLINFNLNDNEEEVSSMNCEDISNADIIPPSPDCKLDQKTCISVKQELERISEMDKNSPLYLNGHRVSPIIGTMFLNHTSPSLSRLNVNSSSTPLNTAGSHSKVNSNTTSCVEAKHSDSWKQGTKTSSKNLNSLFDDSSGRGIILKKNRKRKVNCSHLFS